MDWIGVPTNTFATFLRAYGIEGGASPRILAVSHVDKLDKPTAGVQQDSF